MLYFQINISKTCFNQIKIIVKIIKNKNKNPNNNQIMNPNMSQKDRKNQKK